MPIRWAPATPPTSTRRGITTARSSCSPLRTISRDSIDACARTCRGSGAAPGRGLNVPVSVVMGQPAAGDLEEDVLEVALSQVQGLGQHPLLLTPPRHGRQRRAVGGAGDQQAGPADRGDVDLRAECDLQGGGGGGGGRAWSDQPGPRPTPPGGGGGG